MLTSAHAKKHLIQSFFGPLKAIFTASTLLTWTTILQKDDYLPAPIK